MPLSISHGLRTRQWLSFLKGWLTGKSGRPWAFEVIDHEEGNTLHQRAHDVALATTDRLKEVKDQFDDVLAYKRELDGLCSLRRDIDYSRRSRRWLWERAAKTKAEGHFAEWTAYARRNTSTKVMTAARLPLTEAGAAELKTVIGNG